MNKAKKPWTHFSLRDLFWLVLVVALAVGWWRDRTKLVEDRNRAIVEVQELTAVTSLQIAVSDANLFLKDMELHKLRDAIRQLDQASQDKLQGLVQNSPETDESGPRVVSDPGSKIED